MLDGKGKQVGHQQINNIIDVEATQAWYDALNEDDEEDNETNN